VESLLPLKVLANPLYKALTAYVFIMNYNVNFLWNR